MPITAACTLKGGKKGGEGEKVKLMSDMQETYSSLKRTIF